MCHWEVTVNQEGLKLYGTHPPLVYSRNDSILSASVRTIRKTLKLYFVSNKETGLEVNADKTKYMVVPRDQNAGKCHNIKIDNISFEMEEQFRYLGTTLTNQISIQE